MGGAACVGYGVGTPPGLTGWLTDWLAASKRYTVGLLGFLLSVVGSSTVSFSARIFGKLRADIVEY